MKKKSTRKTAKELGIGKSGRGKHKKEVEEFLSGREIHQGNDIIKHYVRGDGDVRCAWIYYFYTDCTDKEVIRESCKHLCGGHNERNAKGYVGAYTLLQELSEYSVEYWAGFNYSFEQMSANYD